MGELIKEQKENREKANKSIDEREINKDRELETLVLKFTTYVMRNNTYDEIVLIKEEMMSKSAYKKLSKRGQEYLNKLFDAIIKYKKNVA